MSCTFNLNNSKRPFGLSFIRDLYNGTFLLRDIKSRIVMATAAFNRKTLCTRNFGLNLRKKLVKCCIWSTALYGAETWTFRKVDQK